MKHEKRLALTLNEKRTALNLMIHAVVKNQENILHLHILLLMADIIPSNAGDFVATGYKRNMLLALQCQCQAVIRFSMKKQ